MSKLDELMNDYKIEEYLLDGKGQLELSKEYKEKIRMKTLQKIPSETCGVQKQFRKKRILKLSRMVAVFAAVICMSGIVLASVKGDGVFTDFLHVKNNKIENSIHNMSTSIDEEKIVNGYSVKLRQCLSDNNSAYILLNIVAPEGIKLNSLQYCFENGDIFVDGGGAMGYYSTVLEDENKEDNKISILYSLDHHSGVTGKKIRLKLKNLSYYGNDSELVTQAFGTWEFEFLLKKNVECKQIWQFKKLQIDNRTYWITSLRISPIAVSIDMNQSISNLWKSGYLNISDLLDEISVTLKDGESVRIVSGGAGTKGIGYSFDCMFEKAIDLDEVDSIQFMGITLKYK